MENYITDIVIVNGKNASVPSGYMKIDIDLNKNAGGDYVYLGYKKSSAGNGIVGLCIVKGKNATAPAGYIRIDVDLNNKAGGDYLYLCKKTGGEDEARRNGITDLAILEGKDIAAPSGYTKIDVDLNHNAGGEYLYLCYKTQSVKYITDIAIVNGKNPGAPAGFSKLNVDLNKSAGGDDIYLCYKEGTTGNGLTDLLALVSDKKDVPLPPQGYEIVGCDLNKGAGGNYVYLCKKIGNEEEAKLFGITDLAVIIGQEAVAPEGFVRLDVDLNEKAGGDYLYLCYKRPVTPLNWMSGIDGNLKLSRLSIPGTHDTLAYSFTFFSGFVSDAAKCQYLTIEDQLKAGVRYFDIRVDNNLDGRHGKTTCATNFHQALDAMKNFLDAQPTEALIFRLKHEADTGKQSTFKSEMEKIFGTKDEKGLRRYFWRTQKSGSNDAIPFLKDVRGKIIIMDALSTSSHGYSPYDEGFGLRGGSFKWKEDWKDPKLDEKYKNLIAHIEAYRFNQDELSGCGINATGSDANVGLNVVGDFAPWILAMIPGLRIFAPFALLFKLADNIPAKYAEIFNPLMCEYLMRNNYKTGIMAFDFISSYIADRVIVHNYGGSIRKTDVCCVEYCGHIQGSGWLPDVSSGFTAGSTGRWLRLEAVKIKLAGAPANAKIIYSVYIQNQGWQAEKQNGAEAGTTGKSLRLEAIKIRLENFPGYSVKYRVHMQDLCWGGWVSDGAVAGTTGQHRRAEAIEVYLHKL